MANSGLLTKRAQLLRIAIAGLGQCLNGAQAQSESEDIVWLQVGVRYMLDEQPVKEGRKLKLLLDNLHGEDHLTYDKFIKLLSERCQVTILKKKPLDLETLIENDVFLLISPSKSWEEAEIETVRRYVEREGGILVAMTLDGRKPERLNKLLEPYGLSVAQGKLDEKHLDKDVLESSQLLEGIESLTLGMVWGYPSTRIEASNEPEVVLQYNDAILGAKRSLGKGIAHVFSCLPLFGNKQLGQVDNRRFLDNLLKSLAAPAMTATLEAIAKDEALAVQAETTSTAEEYEIGFQDPLPEVTGESKIRQNWDPKGLGRISWSEYGLDIAGPSRLSAAEEAASLGVLGQVLVRTFFETMRTHTVHVATEEIVKVVLTPLLESPKSPNSGVVHIFTEKSDGIQDVHCVCFTEPEETRSSWPPLWRFWGWLIESISADKLEVRGEEYDRLKSSQFHDAVTTDTGEFARPDLVVNPEENLEEQLGMLLDELLPSKPTQNWYRQPQIPSKKLKNAISAYAPEIGADEVLFLGDTTVFGSAKSGWMLTKRGIHYNSGARGSATWKEIQKAASAGGFPQYYLELTINRGDKVEKVKIECSSFQEVRPALQEFINHMAVFSKKTPE